MEDNPPKLDSELEFFRQQWQSELKSKKPVPQALSPQSKKPSPSSSKAAVPPESSKNIAVKKSQVEEDEEYARSLSFDEPPPPTSSGRTLEQPASPKAKELVSALDHFEEAVEKEAIGKLGDSLKLYRKAFRLDNRVDLAYRKKHFPAAVSKPSQSSTSNAQVAAFSTTGKLSETQQQSMSELIASFSGLSVAAAPPPVEGDPAPPCPIADLPEEILVHIFKDLAVLDVGDFVRLSLVCKRFAYIVATEQQIWRRVALGTEFGFAGMHYHWQKGIAWEPLEQDDEAEDNEFVSMEELTQRRIDENEATTLALLPELYSSSWSKLWRHRPRVRYNGCYISTVNYIRAGQANANQITWNSPVHIVTYYRYLRFFRDGTVISLLTTAEPGDVVHYMTKDNLEQHRGGHAAYLPSIVMQHGLKGRWRLSSALDHPDAPLSDVEGELFVETEGVGPKYIYRMDLSMRNAGKGARNTKLVWKSFFSHNRLTDDWGEFGLKNDKPFFFSRVKSYGIGE
ncbi:F-box protein pof7 [Colletotrichum truncatum]|uniref:F-box protein pof7 n=1 Tax=Colletotrichum truncatum TaxID=5467 RepID=A0ACC3YTQ6_COLTU|nr:F-box protein pof7 [Colletotrichum truncatum]KAF6798509.1 F-box protein pof7 [Colletotrichum truncatum]